MWRNNVKSRVNRSICFPKRQRMVITKHCYWDECKTDPRYSHNWPKSLLELQESGKKVFTPFHKPSQDNEHCKRWIGVYSLHRKECHKEYLHLCCSLARWKRPHFRKFRAPQGKSYARTTLSRTSLKRKALKSRSEPLLGKRSQLRKTVEKN